MDNKNIFDALTEESRDVLEDLSLIFEHLNRQEGKYACFIKTKVKFGNEEKLGYANIDNIEIPEVLEIANVFKGYIKSKIATNDCECVGCKEAIQKLKKIIE